MKLREHNKQIFWHSGLMDLLGVDHIFSKTMDAISFIEGKKTEYSSYQMLLDDEEEFKV